MSQHTPGPWTNGTLVLNDGSVAVVNPDLRRRICRVDDDGDLEANARLIAAAPDLLALVLKAHKDLCGCQSFGEDCGWPDARAAIAKATGEVVALTTEDK